MHILIADDHPFIRKGIRETLEEHLTGCTVSEAADGISAYSLLISKSFDLAIVDISMPGKDGLTLIRDVHALRPTARFLVLSVYTEMEFAERAYSNGAMGYLDKMCDPETMVSAVKHILKGNIYVSPTYAEVLVRRLSGAQSAVDQNVLTDREFSVLRMIAHGKPLKMIGEELNISIKTVSTHKKRIMEKLGKTTNAELIAYAIEHGLNKAM